MRPKSRTPGQAVLRKARYGYPVQADPPVPAPANPEIIDKDGKPHVWVKERGKSVFYPLSDDRTQYLKPAAKWAADVRFADGKRRRVRFSPNRDAAAVMLTELLKRIENEKAGVIDRTTEHRKRPLSAH